MNVEDIALACDYDIADAGQIHLLDQSTALRGFMAKVFDGENTASEYIYWNARYFASRDFNPNTKGVVNFTLPVDGIVTTVAFVA